MELNESQTRALLINPPLVAVDWNLRDRTQFRFEVPVEGYDPAPWNGITDFCLYHPSGRVLSVVEAKRASRDPRAGKEQLRQYVTEIARKQDFAPLGFMANGLNIWFWEVGLAHPRMVAGFFSPADLERLLFIRQNRQPLAATAINTSIVDRAYQHEAIRRVCETFGQALRRALLVMATGTGKTHTIMDSSAAAPPPATVCCPGKASRASAFGPARVPPPSRPPLRFTPAHRLRDRVRATCYATPDSDKSAPEGMVQAWWLRQRTTVPLRWVSERLAVGHFTRVSQAITQIQRRPARKHEQIKRLLRRVPRNQTAA